MASVEGDMTRQGFTATQALEQMVASEDEGPEEDVSEEEDGEEYDPEHDDDAVDDEEAPDVGNAAADDDRPGDRRADGEIYLSKNGKIAWSSVPCRARQGSPPGGRHGGCGTDGAGGGGSVRHRLGVQPVHHAARGGDRPGGHEPRGLSATRRRLARDGRGRPACLHGPADPGRCVQVPGEAAASLWDAESGRPIFRATMPLKVFYAYSSLLRFDDRETRPSEARSRQTGRRARALGRVVGAPAEPLQPRARRDGGRAAGPASEVAVRFAVHAEQAGRGTDQGVGVLRRAVQLRLEDAGVHGEDAHGPERNLGARVVFDLTKGLPRDHTVTCDNFFTSYELAQRLLADRGLAWSARCARTSPSCRQRCFATKTRRVLSPAFATPIATLVSYLARRNRNVLLLSTLHADARLSDRADRKPAPSSTTTATRAAWTTWTRSSARTAADG
ncbi:hypothetical protein DPEC_G00379450 [Dallia pectoralis]|nr:hypothetical protein DPEC_G00379450 [Dallia pectoralis]